MKGCTTETMNKEKRRGSIIIQVAVLFLIGVAITGILTYISETRLYDESVKKQTELHAAQIADETARAVKVYPAYPWLIRYWHSHADSMEIEYDDEFKSGSLTARKCAAFAARHPGLQLQYLTAAQAEALPEEDQKLCAEILYAWLITRIDQIKQAYRVDYLFCVISREPFEQQFFLFSGAEPGAVRGTNYEEVYPLGHTVTVSESQRTAMRRATLRFNYLADAGDYVDYYSTLFSFDGYTALIGLTYDLSALKENIAAQTRSGYRLAIINQLILSGICLGLIWLFVLRPLKKVQKHIRQYKQTKDSTAVTAELAEVRSRNEIGHLADDVRDMIREIDLHVDNIRSITAEKERIGTELALATRIQASMLPSVFPPFPERREFDVYASMDPAKEVGGDFYDFFLVDEDHLCMVMADVSGKGVPAALFMMASRIILASYAKQGMSPAEIMRSTNETICQNNREEMFVTVWLGILEISTGKLTAANAGHEYPVLMQPGGSCELYKDKHGFVLGGMDGVRYKEYQFTLRPGARLFLYTDGVPEATNAENELFGTERMLAALNEDLSADPQQVLLRVRRAVDGFVGSAEQFDDLTMLCLEYKGKEK